MPYTFLTFGQAKTRLAQRLYDASKKFFADAELGVYIKEALQTFNALANFNRAEFVFPSQQNVSWYDLTDEEYQKELEERKTLQKKTTNNN